jgi:predicted lipoprotein with Yx(FWY)xxD motif
MKFQLVIDSDNAAMQNSADVSNALRSVCKDLDLQVLERELAVMQMGRVAKEHDGVIRDANGNTVGTWKLVREDK